MVYKSITFFLSISLICSSLFGVGAVSDQSLNKAFYKACESNDKESARELINRGADVNFYVLEKADKLRDFGTYAKTLVMVAIDINSPDMLQLLLDNGANPDGIVQGEKSYRCISPLAYLCDPETIRLHENQFETFKTKSDFESYNQMITLLIKAGAYPNARAQSFKENGQVIDLRLLNTMGCMFMGYPNKKEATQWLVLYEAFGVIFNSLTIEMVQKVEGIEKACFFKENSAQLKMMYDMFVSLASEIKSNLN